MRVELSEKLQLLKENYAEAKAEFRWDMAIFNHFIALNYATKNKTVDSERIKEIKRYIKENTGVFSKFRGNSLPLMSLMLSFEENYKEIFNEIEEWSNKLKDNKISSYEYGPMIAYILIKNSNYEDREEKIRRTKLFYEDMADNHMFLTAKDDYVYATLLGCTDLDVKETCNKIEFIYNKLNGMGYARRNGLQTVSHILALSDDYDFRLGLFNQMVSELDRNGVRTDSYTWPSIAVLALVVDEANEIINEVAEVYKDLKHTKGYGSFSMQGYIRTILSCILTTSIYTEGNNKLAEISTGLSMQLIAVAQQQAMMAASAAAASAAASSSS